RHHGDGGRGPLPGRADHPPPAASTGGGGGLALSPRAACPAHAPRQGEPPGRRLPRPDPGGGPPARADLSRLSPAVRAGGAAGGLDERRRAADARHRTGAHVPTEAAPRRRTLPRPRTDRRRRPPPRPGRPAGAGVGAAGGGSGTRLEPRRPFGPPAP